MNSGHPLDILTAPVLSSRNQTALSITLPLAVDDSSILSYELQIDNGHGGTYRSVGGLTEESMQTQYTIGALETGLTYRVRYRTKNYVGWSAYSPVLYALVATVPSPPASPKLVSATAT